MELVIGEYILTVSSLKPKTFTKKKKKKGKRSPM